MDVLERAAHHWRPGPAGGPGLRRARPARARPAGARRGARARRQRAPGPARRARAVPQRRSGLARGHLRLRVRVDALLRRGRARDAVAAARLAPELEPRDGRAGQQRPAADRGHRRAGPGRGGDAARRRSLRGRHAPLGRTLPAHERGELRRDRGRRNRGRPRLPRGRDGVGRHVAPGGAGGDRRDRGRDARASAVGPPPLGEPAEGQGFARRWARRLRAAARRGARELRAPAGARPAGDRRLRRLPRLRDRRPRRLLPGLRGRGPAGRGVRPRPTRWARRARSSRRLAASAAPRAG